MRVDHQYNPFMTFFFFFFCNDDIQDLNLRIVSDKEEAASLNRRCYVREQTIYRSRLSF